VWKLSGTNL